MAHARHQREEGFNQHSFTPRFVFTELEITRLFACLSEAKIAQDNGFLVELVSHMTKMLVMAVGRIPVPTDYFTPVIDQPAQLNPDYPATIRLTFLAYLLLTASFSHRMDQFNPIAIDDGEEGGVCQQILTPVAMRAQRSLNAAPVGQLDEQGLEIAFQPA